MLSRLSTSLLFFVGLGTRFLFSWKVYLTSLSLAFAQSELYVDPDNDITFGGVTDPVHGVTYGYILPPLEDESDEFIGEIVDLRPAFNIAERQQCIFPSLKPVLLFMLKIWNL